MCCVDLVNECDHLSYSCCGCRLHVLTDGVANDHQPICFALHCAIVRTECDANHRTVSGTVCVAIMESDPHCWTLRDPVPGAKHCANTRSTVCCTNDNAHCEPLRAAKRWSECSAFGDSQLVTYLESESHRLTHDGAICTANHRTNHQPFRFAHCDAKRCAKCCSHNVTQCFAVYCSKRCPVG